MERAKKRTITLDKYGCASTTTKSGKEAFIQENDMNYYSRCYKLVVDGKTVITRGKLETILKKLEEM